MARAKHIDRPKHIGTVIPSSLHAKVQLELFSDLEGRVPYGAFQTLITSLLTEWLRGRGVEV